MIINAAECEPYITGDHRTMLERPEQVIKGATLLAKCFGVEHVYIGIEANKQNAADVLQQDHRRAERSRGGGGPAHPLSPGR